MAVFPIQQTPLITAPPRAWYDAADLSAGSVASWTDKSGNGNHLTQATSGFRPVCTANQRAGKNGVIFDGTDDYLICDALASVALSPFSFFIVMKPTSIAATGIMLSWQRLPDIGGTEQFKYSQQTTGTESVEYGNSITIFDTVNRFNTTFVTSATVSSSTFTSLINGATTTTPTVSDTLRTSLAGFSVGQEWDSTTPSNFYAGNIYELMIYDYVLSDAQILQLNRYCMNKWGIA